MSGVFYVLYVLFGTNLSAAATGFQDEKGCNEAKAVFVKTLHPTKAYCLPIDFRPRGVKE